MHFDTNVAFPPSVRVSLVGFLVIVGVSIICGVLVGLTTGAGEAVGAGADVAIGAGVGEGASVGAGVSACCSFAFSSSSVRPFLSRNSCSVSVYFAPQAHIRNTRITASIRHTILFILLFSFIFNHNGLYHTL